MGAVLFSLYLFSARAVYAKKEHRRCGAQKVYACGASFLMWNSRRSTALRALGLLKTTTCIKLSPFCTGYRPRARDKSSTPPHSSRTAVAGRMRAMSSPAPNTDARHCQNSLRRFILCRLSSGVLFAPLYTRTEKVCGFYEKKSREAHAHASRRGCLYNGNIISPTTGSLPRLCRAHSSFRGGWGRCALPSAPRAPRSPFPPCGSSP